MRGTALCHTPYKAVMLKCLGESDGGCAERAAEQRPCDSIDTERKEWY